MKLSARSLKIRKNSSFRFCVLVAKFGSCMSLSLSISSSRRSPSINFHDVQVTDDALVGLDR